jgi:hypothetical protein
MLHFPKDTKTNGPCNWDSTLAQCGLEQARCTLFVDHVDCPECNRIEDEDCEHTEDPDLASYDVTHLAGLRVSVEGWPNPGTVEYRILECALHFRDNLDQAVTTPDFAMQKGLRHRSKPVLKALAHRMKQAGFLSSPARAMYEPTDKARWWLQFQAELARKA